MQNKTSQNLKQVVYANVGFLSYLFFFFAVLFREIENIYLGSLKGTEVPEWYL